MLYEVITRAGGDDETIRAINSAYAVLRRYCEAYRFDFSQA